MKHALLLPILTVFMLMTVVAQRVNENMPMVRRELVKYKGFYRFSGFSEGTVVLKNGIVSSGRLNYNISLDEMQFINQQGDTLAIAQPDSINVISLKGYRFYYDKGYLQSIYANNDTVLAFKQVLKTEHQKKESYSVEVPQPEKTISAYSFFTGNGQKYDLDAEDQLILSAKEYFFFGDGKGGFTKAGKEYFFQRYEKHQPAIKEFIKTNHSNFDKLEDILALMQFCNKLK